MHRLVAGERRCQACREIGIGDIPVRFADELSSIEAQIFELEENIKRQDLSWKDLVKAAQKIHELYKSLDENWTQEKTADALALNRGTVSMYLTVASELEWNEKVQSADAVREAYNYIKRKEDRERETHLDEILHNDPFGVRKRQARQAVQAAAAPAPAPEGEVVSTAPPAPPIVDIHDYKVEPTGNPAKNILLEDFRLWAPKYIGQRFNFIHCDFPYGINIFEGPQAGKSRHLDYVDTKETHFSLLECLLENFDRLASSSCHVLYWFSMQHYDLIRRMVADMVPDLIIQTNPLIWLKSDNSGISPDSRRLPRHVYESALLMVRGQRQIVQIMADAYAAPSDKEIHIHTKPEPMLRHFFTMFVDENTVMLDPTCGSGTSIRAAESLHAGTVVGMDIDEGVVMQARTALRHFRALHNYVPHLGSDGKFRL